MNLKDAGDKHNTSAYSGIETQDSSNSMQIKSILCPTMHTELTHDRTVMTQCASKVNEVVIQNAN
jgi:hypothetical protein